MFGLCRVRNLYWGDLGGVQEHNNREYGLGEAPENLNKDFWQLSKYQDFCIENGNTPNSTIYDAVENQLEDYRIKTKKRVSDKKTKDGRKRKESIVALEYVVGASADWWAKVTDDKDAQRHADEYLEKMIEFVRTRHGDQNVISVAKHYDESNIHAHVVVTPVELKLVKQGGNRFCDAKEVMKPCLSAQDYTNKKEQYRQLQDDYVKFFNESVATMHHHPNDMRVHRGKLVTKSNNKYINQTSHEIGELRKERIDINNQLRDIVTQINTANSKRIQELRDEGVKLRDQSVILDKQITSKTKEIEKTKAKNEGIKKGYKKNNGGNWKKGFDPFSM